LQVFADVAHESTKVVLSQSKVEPMILAEDETGVALGDELEMAGGGGL